MRKILKLMVFAFLVINIKTASADPLSDRIMLFTKNTVDEMRAVLNSDAPEDVQKEKLLEIINESFDIQRMSRFILGKTWKDISVDQRKEFVSIYERYVVSIYYSVLVSVKNDSFEVKKIVSPQESKYYVSGSIFNDNNSITVEIRLSKDVKGAVKIYDIVTDGISVLFTQRTEINSFLRENDFANLLKRLHDKTWF